MQRVNKKLYKEAVQTFGAPAQAVVAMEECSELIKELSKALRHNANLENIAEEIADVEIMVEQLKLMFNVEDLVEHFIRMKNGRLEALISQKRNQA